jgi:nicotinamide mononucleotide transporter
VSRALALRGPEPSGALGYALGAAASATLVGATWQEWVRLPLDRTEVLAFVTGAWCVWLAARNNVWNWPIGVLNSAFFVVLFWNARLFFDMGINVFYVVSGLWGWWIWTFGGQQRSERPITRVGRREAGLLALAGVVLTLGMWERGIAINDAAPFLDALTAAVSLLASGCSCAASWRTGCSGSPPTWSTCPFTSRRTCRSQPCCTACSC